MRLGPVLWGTRKAHPHNPISIGIPLLPKKKVPTASTSAKTSAKADQSGPSSAFSQFIQIILFHHSEDGLFHLYGASWETVVINSKRMLSHSLLLTGKPWKNAGSCWTIRGNSGCKISVRVGPGTIKIWNKATADCLIFPVMSSRFELINSIQKRECLRVKPKIQLLVQFSPAKFNTGGIVIENKFTFALSVKWKGEVSSAAKAMNPENNQGL